MFRLIFTDGIF